jgi:hypothetical protein
MIIETPGLHSFVTIVKDGRWTRTIEKSRGELVKHGPKAHASLKYFWSNTLIMSQVDYLNGHPFCETLSIGPFIVETSSIHIINKMKHDKDYVVNLWNRSM